MNSKNIINNSTSHLINVSQFCQEKKKQKKEKDKKHSHSGFRAVAPFAQRMVWCSDSSRRAWFCTFCRSKGNHNLIVSVVAKGFWCWEGSVEVAVMVVVRWSVIVVVVCREHSWLLPVAVVVCEVPLRIADHVCGPVARRPQCCCRRGAAVAMVRHNVSRVTRIREDLWFPLHLLHPFQQSLWGDVPRHGHSPCGYAAMNAVDACPSIASLDSFRET